VGEEKGFAGLDLEPAEEESRKALGAGPGVGGRRMSACMCVLCSLCAVCCVLGAGCWMLCVVEIGIGRPAGEGESYSWRENPTGEGIGHERCVDYRQSVRRVVFRNGLGVAEQERSWVKRANSRAEDWKKPKSSQDGRSAGNLKRFTQWRLEIASGERSPGLLVTEVC
jgi:hypothetical protein